MSDLFHAAALADLKAQFEKTVFKDGDSCRCPVCDQHAKLYKRHINSTMARDLISLYRATMRGEGADNDGFVHLNQLDVRATGFGDFAKLRFWGLIEAMPNTDEAKRCSGFWRITPAGKLFVKGELSVHGRALLYNAKCIGLTDKLVTIRDCLGIKFNYSQLMEE